MPVTSTAIIGAGVSGLVLALSLARKGISSDLFEQADSLSEVGAGLQISPNAARILDDIGILSGLRAVWTEPQSVDLCSGITLRPEVSIPMGEAAVARWKAPYGVLHRATLQKALVEAVNANSLCRLHLGMRLEPKSLAEIAPFCERKPDLVVGADGVWSRARGLVPGAPEVRYSGNVAWRFLIPFAGAPDVLARDRVSAFMGLGAHLVCYPLKETGTFNLVAITRSKTLADAWNTLNEPARRLEVSRHFAGWNPVLRDLLRHVEGLLYWPLCEATAGCWQNGRDAVLIGDAAHAMMPFMAQGAAMAIEDAATLAHLLATEPLPEALGTYERQRKPRIARLARRVAVNRLVYHARGPMRWGRDLALRLRPPERYLADFDWLYGFGVPGAGSE